MTQTPSPSLGLPEHKLITCVLPRGRGMPLLAALRRDQGIVAAHVHHGRGVGASTRLDGGSLGDQTEKDIVSVAVPVGRAEEVFAYLYQAAEVDRPHGGIIFQSPLSLATLFALPEIPEEA